MKAYKQTIIIVCIITLVTFMASIILYYFCNFNGVYFWVDVSLGIFGGALLTTLTAMISYFHERRKTLESFAYHTRQILSYLSKYHENMALENKLKFFLGYIDMDKSAWDSDYGNMDFLFEIFAKNRKYIYNNIYQPMLQFNQTVSNYSFNFRYYLNRSGYNAEAMEDFVSELEKYLIRRTEQNVPKEYDNAGKPKEFCKIVSVEPKLVLEIQEHLNGPYFEILYGKRNSSKAEKEDTYNEQNEI